MRCSQPTRPSSEPASWQQESLRRESSTVFLSVWPLTLTMTQLEVLSIKAVQALSRPRHSQSPELTRDSLHAPSTAQARIFAAGYAVVSVYKLDARQRRCSHNMSTAHCF